MNNLLLDGKLEAFGIKENEIVCFTSLLVKGIEVIIIN